MNMKLNYLVIGYLALLALMFGGILTSGGMVWYQALVLPAWHPSEFVIALIWTSIYVCAGLSLGIVWNTFPVGAYRRLILGGFVVGAILNLLWSVIFFRLHLLTASSICALLLGIAALLLIGFLWLRARRAALLLVPYAAWVLFAAYLAYVVLTLNS